MRTEAKMADPIFFPLKVVTFFGKEHVDWSSIRELLKNEVRKSSLEKLNKKIMDLIVQLLPIITPLILDQLTSSLPM